ncbi:transposase [Desulfonatronovibrio hydrogenovorans]|uniref:transposase n=1 Tax=Desulfonatronovibrio hydrogenovorans TaxID=53245 RepID=UPI000A00675D
MRTRQITEGKILTQRGRRTYYKRSQTVEPAIGNLKTCQNMSSFLLRGLKKEQLNEMFPVSPTTQ